MVLRDTDLTPETRAKLKLSKGLVPNRVVALGKILQNLEQLSTRDAYWCLRTAHSYVAGYHRPSRLTTSTKPNNK